MIVATRARCERPTLVAAASDDMLCGSATTHNGEERRGAEGRGGERRGEEGRGGERRGEEGRGGERRGDVGVHVWLQWRRGVVPWDVLRRHMSLQHTLTAILHVQQQGGMQVADPHRLHAAPNLNVQLHKPKVGQPFLGRTAFDHERTSRGTTTVAEAEAEALMHIQTEARIPP